MRAQIRHRGTSLFSGWRGRKKFCALQHNSLYNAQAFRFMFYHLFKGSYSFEGPFRHAYFNLEDSFVFLPTSVFSRVVSKSHHSGSADCIRTTFHLIQKFFGRRLFLPLALYPFLLFFLRFLKKLFRFRSFKKYSHIPCMYWSFPQHFPQSATMFLLFHNCLPLPRH